MINAIEPLLRYGYRVADTSRPWDVATFRDRTQLDCRLGGIPEALSSLVSPPRI